MYCKIKLHLIDQLACVFELQVEYHETKSTGGRDIH